MKRLTIFVLLFICICCFANIYLFVKPSMEYGYKDVVLHIIDKPQDESNHDSSINEIDSIHCLIFNLLDADDYEATDLEIEKILGIKEKDLIENNRWKERFFTQLTQHLLNKAQYNYVIKYGKVLLNLQKQLYDEQDDRILQTYINLFVSYESVKDFINAIKYAERATMVLKDKDIPDITVYPNILSRLAVCIASEYHQEKKDQVEKYIDKAIQSVEPLKLFYKEEYFDDYTRLIMASEDVNDTILALKLSNEILPQLRTYYRNSESLLENYYYILDFLQAYYRETQDYDSQYKIINEQRQVAHSGVRGSDLAWYAKSLSSLIECSFLSGNYQNAWKTFLEYKDFITQNVELIPNHEFGMSMYRMAWFCHLFGMDSNAYTFADLTLKVFFYSYGIYNRSTLMAAIDFIKYAEILGYENDAIAWCQLIIDSMEKDGKKQENARKFGDMLSFAYWCLSKYLDAPSLMTEAYKIADKYYGPTDQTTLEYLFYVGRNMYDVGDLSGLSIMKTAFSNMMDLYKSRPMNMARSLSEVLCKMGTFDYGIEVEKGYMSKPIINPESYLASLVNLANLYLLSHQDTIQWIGYIQKIDRAQQDVLSLKRYHSLNKELSFILQSSAYSKWHDLILPQLAYYLENDSVNIFLYNSKLQNNNLQVSYEARIKNEYLLSEDSIASKYRKLTLLQNLLTKLNEDDSDESIGKAISLQDSIRRLEWDLKAYEREHFAVANPSTWEDVKNSLKTDEVAIEFIEFRDTTNIDQYVALLLKNHYAAPMYVRLCTKDEIDEVLSSKKEKDAYMRFLYKLIWQPIESELVGVKNIYFAPSGILHQLPVEYLISSSQEILSEKYNLYRLSSTSEISNKKEKTNLYNQAVLCGGLDYDAIINDNIATKTDTVFSFKFDTHLSSPSYRTLGDSIRARGGFDALVNSYQEVQEVKKCLEKKNVSTDLLTGSLGTETSIKNLHGERVNIIHFATHGMYLLPDEAGNRRSDNNYRFISSRPADSYYSKEDKALTRSFLVMAGGNSLLRRDSVKNSENDGILTALEISQMNFPDLDLVVLSSCQSALGDISSEGVYGLQRGFKKAGAKTILMSIDYVDDEATQLLMVEFYKNLMSGKTKLQSLRDAQRYLRKVEGGKYDEPKYWASFILLDGLD